MGMLGFEPPPGEKCVRVYDVNKTPGPGWLRTSVRVCLLIFQLVPVGITGCMSSVSPSHAGTSRWAHPGLGIKLEISDSDSDSELKLPIFFLENFEIYRNTQIFEIQQSYYRNILAVRKAREQYQAPSQKHWHTARWSPNGSLAGRASCSVRYGLNESVIGSNGKNRSNMKYSEIMKETWE